MNKNTQALHEALLVFLIVNIFIVQERQTYFDSSSSYEYFSFCKLFNCF
jgi:hypothetical protein